MQMNVALSIQVERVRRHFYFPESQRVVTNNAASTQPPRELIALLRTLAPDYENVHRGQSAASEVTTARFEDAYDTIAQFINAPSRANIVVTRNTTEAHSPMNRDGSFRTARCTARRSATR
jgi:cysteine desulfurase/selenocysteine lyase